MVLDLTLLYLKEEEFKKHAGVTGQSDLIPCYSISLSGIDIDEVYIPEVSKKYFSILRQSPRPLCSANL